MPKNVYLRQNVQVEPLINQWYAWVQLVPPATAAFNIAERHIRNMESYVRSPDLHATAVQNPAFRGGPFIDLDGKRADDVARLLETTRTRAAVQLDFTRAVRALDALLERKGDGSSLQALYAELPEMLRGRVELYYDRHHRPDFRLIEPLLYEAPLYDTSFQSIALSTIDRDCGRPFVFSTPRLETRDSVHLPISFDSDGLDALFASKTTPRPLHALRDAVGAGLRADQEDLFASFFTEEPPAPSPRYDGDAMRIRYFGHACLLLEAAGTSILFDPVISYRYDAELPRFTYGDLPDTIDYVLITHSHHDHILIETLLQIRHKVRQVIVPANCKGVLQDPSLKLMLERLGFRNVREMSEYDTFAIPEGVVTAVPFLGEHHDLLVGSKLGYHIRHRGRTFLAAADSCNVDPALYDHLARLVGKVDVLFLGMECEGAPVSWVYGPLFTKKPEREQDRSRRGRGSNCAEAMAIIERLGCSEVYVYAMGAEPWVRYLLGLEYTNDSTAIVQSNRFIEACRASGRVAERLCGERELG